MGDQIEKILSKLSSKERKKLIALIEQILSGQYAGMDMKKLKGHAGTYRVRKGNFRVIFIQRDNEEIRVIALERRTDTTYNL